MAKGILLEGKEGNQRRTLPGGLGECVQAEMLWRARHQELEIARPSTESEVAMAAAHG